MKVLYTALLYEVPEITSLISDPVAILVKRGLYLESLEHEWRKKFVDSFVDVWKSISSCYGFRMKGNFNNVTLKQLSPLLVCSCVYVFKYYVHCVLGFYCFFQEVAFLLCKYETNLKITVNFWSKTFANCKDLQYPNNLRYSAVYLLTVHRALCLLNQCTGPYTYYQCSGPYTCMYCQNTGPYT